MMYLKTYEEVATGFNQDFKHGEIVICIHERHYGEKYEVLTVIGPNMEVRNLVDRVKRVWSKDYFIKEKDWEMYQTSNKYNL